MNLGDPEWELIDPTPNVHSLFIQFDKLFFWTKLASRAVVRWSKRMYSCAGICSYDGRLCDIALSEPLLKLRPRKDLIETLLHEMIHAFLFITNRDRDRDGHGPNFQAHMHRINKSAGINITIYHDFHDEVKLYQTHWWRCNGPCQTKKPYFGIVRRSNNRAPGPSDYWWVGHQKICGGNFVKIKEPNKPDNKFKKPVKPSADITKFINIIDNSKNTIDKNASPILNDSNSIPVKSNVATKSNNSSTLVITKKNIVFNPKSQPIVVFSGSGHTITGRKSTGSDAAETVRNVWANKKIPTTASGKPNEVPSRNNFGGHVMNTKKTKAEKPHINSPPMKITKINDYFKSNAKAILNEIYGQDFEIKQLDKSTKTSAIPIKLEIVDCPICNSKIRKAEINKHLDECLNREVIEELSKSNVNDEKETCLQIEPVKKLSDIPCNNNINEVNSIPSILRFNDKIFQNSTVVKDNNISQLNKSLDLTDMMGTSKTIINNTNSDEIQLNNYQIKIEPGTSKDDTNIIYQKCPCCGNNITKPIDEHLDECLAFFDNNTSIPDKGSSSIMNDIIIIDDDDEDEFDETLTLNATGTKSPCPVCLKMIEQADMNDHLDMCLNKVFD